MGRFLLLLPGLLTVLGCESDRDVERAALVEVVSEPSSLLMSVSVGFKELLTFEAETPIARSVRAKASCSLPTEGPSSAPNCTLVAIASVKNGDPTGVRVTACLTDADTNVRKCKVGKDGRVSVSIEIDPRE